MDNLKNIQFERACRSCLWERLRSRDWTLILVGVAGESGAVWSAKFFELENFRALALIRGSENCGSLHPIARARCHLRGNTGPLNLKITRVIEASCNK
jgi:hypothetical protein